MKRTFVLLTLVFCFATACVSKPKGNGAGYGVTAAKHCPNGKQCKENKDCPPPNQTCK